MHDKPTARGLYNHVYDVLKVTFLELDSLLRTKIELKQNRNVTFASSQATLCRLNHPATRCLKRVIHSFAVNSKYIFFTFSEYILLICNSKDANIVPKLPS